MKAIVLVMSLVSLSSMPTAPSPRWMFEADCPTCGCGVGCDCCGGGVCTCDDACDCCSEGCCDGGCTASGCVGG